MRLPAVAAIFLLSRQYLRGATILALAVWLVLGFLGATIAQEPRPKNYILNVIQSGELDVHTPLRWHGVLRDEPVTLPWGVSYEIELTSVDYRDMPISIQGGLAGDLHARRRRACFAQRTRGRSSRSRCAGTSSAILSRRGRF